MKICPNCHSEMRTKDARGESIWPLCENQECLQRRCDREARDRDQHEADARLGRAVREASAGRVLMRGWAEDESMPDVVRRVFRAIADALWKERT